MIVCDFYVNASTILNKSSKECSMSGALLSTLWQIYVKNERRKQTIPASQAFRSNQDGGQDGEPTQLYSLVRPHAKGTTQLVC